MRLLLITLLTAFFVGNVNCFGYQIDAQYIAGKIGADCSKPSDQYLEYGEKLARTLNQLSSEQLARVFGEPVSVEVDEEPTLNEELDLSDINFDSGSANLTPAAKEELDKVVEFLAGNDSVILIEGHTRKDRMSLSENRAISAKSYLVSKGVDPTRIETIGMSNSVAASGYADGDDENRRIEIKTLY